MSSDLDPESGAFLPRVFSVVQRLQSLAIHAAESAPSPTPDDHAPLLESISNPILTLLGGDCCVVQSLVAPDMDSWVVHDLMNLRIDYKSVRKALADVPTPISISQDMYGNLFYKQIKSRWEPRPDTCEDVYKETVHGAMTTTIALAATALLQLWINEKAEDSDEFASAAAFLVRLREEEQKTLQFCKPDHLMSTTTTSRPDLNRVLATVDRTGSVGGNLAAGF